MLALRRKLGEAIVVDGPCVVRVVKSGPSGATLMVQADDEVIILREEVAIKLVAEAEAAQELGKSAQEV